MRTEIADPMLGSVCSYLTITKGRNYDNSLSNPGEFRMLNAHRVHHPLRMRTRPERRSAVSRKQTLYLAVPVKLHWSCSAEQNASGSINGIRLFSFLMAFCRSSSERSFFALRSAEITGLSSVS